VASFLDQTVGDLARHEASQRVGDDPLRVGPSRGPGT
jgi:hypothetical protein